MKLLGQKIDVRLHQRLRRGMIAEAENLHARGLSYKRMRELGLEYRSLSRLLQGHITRHEFEAELAAAIRRYAHKQIGYWKRNKDIKWFTDAADKSIEQDVKLWLES